MFAGESNGKDDDTMFIDWLLFSLADICEKLEKHELLVQIVVSIITALVVSWLCLKH